MAEPGGLFAVFEGCGHVAADGGAFLVDVGEGEKSPDVLPICGLFEPADALFGVLRDAGSLKQEATQFVLGVGIALFGHALKFVG